MSVNKRIVARNRGLVFHFVTGSYLPLYLALNNPFPLRLLRQHANIIAVSLSIPKNSRTFQLGQEKFGMITRAFPFFSEPADYGAGDSHR